MNIDWVVASNIASFIASIAVVLGVPIGLFQYYRITNKERREHEYRAGREKLDRDISGKAALN